MLERRHRTPNRHRLLFVLIVLIGPFDTIALETRNADAHARLVSASPTGGSALPSPSSEVHRQFSQPVEVQFSRADLLSDDGTAIELAPLETATGDDHILIIRPADPALPTGVYTIV